MSRLLPFGLAAALVFAQSVPAISAPAEAPAREGGTLYSVQKDGTKAPFVLKHTAVNARIAGNLARVSVKQVFTNPFKQPLEAVYAFPLPDQAAVDDMTIKVGKRVIKGQIQERQQARKIYDQAKAQGQTAALLDQERENLFTQRVANIQPGETIEVTIGYSDALQFENGTYEFAFPMVVGPRYLPKGGVVPDADKVVPPHLPVGTRSGRDISLALEIEAGVPVEDVNCTSHRFTVGGTPARRTVTLAADDAIPNRDFILHYRVAGAHTQPTVLTERDGRGGHFAAMLIPALKYHSDEVVPKDVVFLMDTSGSQNGKPIEQSQALMRRMLNGLNGDDTFTIIDFANSATRLSDQPLLNTDANREKALAYVAKLDARGGTELMNGIKTALAFPPASNGRLRSIVLLTDGLIGDDDRVIQELKQHLQRGNRLFSFGVGASSNRFLLERMAQVGRGTCTVLDYDAPMNAVAERFYKQVNDPVLTDIEVRWEGRGQAPLIFPQPARDLFAGQPLVLYGRKPDARPGRLVITGKAAGGKPYRATLDVKFPAAGNPAIAQLWGRQRLSQIMLDMAGKETPAGKRLATQTALGYKLMSRYTSFVAVSSDRRTTAPGATVVVPQEPVAGLTARAYGDPHIVTPHGLRFDMSLLGDFVGFRSRSGDFALHTRIGTGLTDLEHTYNVALGLKVDGTVIRYDAHTRLLNVAGKTVWLKPGEVRHLANGAAIRALDRGWEVTSSKGDRVRITPVGDHVDFKVFPAASRPDRDLSGALGTIDGDAPAHEDLRDRDGKVVAPPTGPKSEAAFLENWRVQPGEQILP
jgi:Ca-activated chloride channel family protein